MLTHLNVFHFVLRPLLRLSLNFSPPLAFRVTSKVIRGQTSKIFAQVMAELNVKHNMSSSYHPESQGALERFHQTLKSMLRKFCAEPKWDEGLPMLLFAVRETAQES